MERSTSGTSYVEDGRWMRDNLKETGGCGHCGYGLESERERRRRKAKVARYSHNTTTLVMLESGDRRQMHGRK